jgi:hypothetical protein
LSGCFKEKSIATRLYDGTARGSCHTSQAFHQDDVPMSFSINRADLIPGFLKHFSGFLRGDLEIAGEELTRKGGAMGWR